MNIFDLESWFMAIFRFEIAHLSYFIIVFFIKISGFLHYLSFFIVFYIWFCHVRITLVCSSLWYDIFCFFILLCSVNRDKYYFVDTIFWVRDLWRITTNSLSSKSYIWLVNTWLNWSCQILFIVDMSEHQ